jgi:hypothetical protein
MKFTKVLIALAAALMFASCTSVMPVAVGPGVVGEKKGTATGIWLFGVLPLGVNNGSYQAAKDGNIKRIATVDVRTTNILGVVVVQTTIVTGDDGEVISAETSEVSKANTSEISE